MRKTRINLHGGVIPKEKSSAILCTHQVAHKHVNHFIYK